MNLDKSENLNDLIDQYNPNVCLKEEDELFYNIFVSPKSVDVFVLFFEKFLSQNKHCLKRDKFFNVLSDLIYQEHNLRNFLCKILYSNELNENDVVLTKFTNILVSMPELIGNIYEKDFPIKFNLKTYISRLCAVMQKVLFEIYNNEKCFNLNWLFVIVGRLCVKGYADFVWDDFLSSIINRSLDDTKWLSIIRSILFGDSKILNNSTSNEILFVEPVLKMFLQNCSCHQTISKIYEPEFLKSSSKSYLLNKMEFLLTNKFLLIHHIMPVMKQENSDLFVLNIFCFLHAVNQDWFRCAVKNILDTWCNSNAYKFRSYSQHFYLCRLLIITSKIIFSMSGYENLRKEFSKSMFYSTDMHLRSAQMEFRSIGLTTSVIIFDLMKQNDYLTVDPPTFEELDSYTSEDCVYLKQISDIDLINYFQAIKISKNVDKNSFEALPQKSDINEKDKLPEKIELDSDDDEDADLLPYDLSTDIDVSDDIRYCGKQIETNFSKKESVENIQDKYLIDNSTKRPIHLQDCIDGLCDYEKPIWMERCLRATEQIVRANHCFGQTGSDCNKLDNYAFALTKILFNLDDKLSINGFDRLRIGSLVALCVGSPKIVASYLSEQFYAPYISIQNRIDVLTVLVGASEELSSLRIEPQKEKSSIIEANYKQKSENKSKKFQLQYFGLNDDLIDSDDDDNDTDNTNGNWRAVIDKRIQSKTRYQSSYARNKLEPKPTILVGTSRFIPFAGYFFFPLLRDPNKTEIHLNFKEDDSFVLEHLLLALGILIQNCTNYPIVKLMAKELIEFLSTFLTHEHRFVKNSTFDRNPLSFRFKKFNFFYLEIFAMPS